MGDVFSHLIVSWYKKIVEKAKTNEKLNSENFKSLFTLVIFG